MRKTILAAAFGVLFASSAALAGDISLEHAWARATSPGAAVGAGYVTVKNAGAGADRLVAASAEVASRVEIHEMSVVDGVMKMRAVKDLEIPAGGAVELKPGSYHIMLMELKQPLTAGETVKGSLTFEKAGTVPVEYKVEAVGAPAMPMDHPHHSE